jgi:hypothetical protein
MKLHRNRVERAALQRMHGPPKAVSQTEPENPNAPGVASPWSLAMLWFRLQAWIVANDREANHPLNGERRFAGAVVVKTWSGSWIGVTGIDGTSWANSPVLTFLASS